MRTLRANDVELAYLERGDGGETVVLAHSYLVDHRQYELQIERLAERYRVIAYDHRDHGRSGRVTQRYGIYDLVADAEALIEGTGAAPCHFVGLSAGGFVGLRIALRSPHLLRSLVALDTSAELEPALKRFKYESMFQVLRLLGFRPLIGTVMSLMFGPDTLRNPERREEMALWAERMSSNDRAALIRFGRAIFARDSLVERLARIDLPTMVVVGEHDGPQPPARARVIAEGIPGARLEIVPRAGHLSTIDNPERVTELLLEFLGGTTSRSSES